MKSSEIEIIKDSKVRKVIQHAMRNDRLGHAYLLCGPNGSGKEALALVLAQTFLCSKAGKKVATASLFDEPEPAFWACGQCSQCHRVAELNYPDLHVVFPRPSTATEKDRVEVLRSMAANPFNRLRPWENAFILINDVRQLKRELAVTSYEGAGAVVLLLEAQRLKAESANALLKILEEPPPSTYFVLTATSLESLLPTIVSRCQPLIVPSLTQSQIVDFLVANQQVDRPRAEFVSKICNNNLRYALSLLEEEVESKRKSAIEFLRMAFRFNRPLDQVEFLNNLIREFDGREIQNLLKLCLLWLRDAYILKTCGSDQEIKSLIVNTDFFDSLLDLNKNLPGFNFDSVLAELEFSIECLERNVQPMLVLMVLLHRIRLMARTS